MERGKLTDQASATPVALRSGRPLTAAQRSLWVSQQQNPTAPVQNMAEIARLHPVGGRAIDAARLARAFARVVEASDVLRTRIVVDHGEPRVVVRPSTDEAKTPVVEVPAAQASAWCAERVRVPIDMSVSAFDSVLLVHEDDTVTWYLGLHHTVTDATSSSLVFNAVAAAYQGDAIELPSYYRWADEQAAVEDRRTERAARHWRNRVPPPPPAQLYAGERVPTAASHRLSVPFGSDLQRRIEDRLDNDLRLLSADLSWSAFFLTATSALMSRVTGAESFSIGLPVHQRTSSAARRVVGPVMQVYPVDVTVEPTDTFRSLHARVAGAVMSTIGNAGPTGAPGGQEIRAVMNLLPETEQRRFGDHEAEVEWIHSGATDPSHLIRVQFTRFGERPRLHLDLNEAAADEVHRARVPHHYSSLLEAIADDPDQIISSVDLLDAEERRVLDRWGQGPDRPDYAGQLTVAARLGPLLSGIDRAVLEGSVLAGGSIELSGHDLWRHVTGVAQWLRKAGVGPGIRVAIDLARSVDAVVTIYATLLAGGSYVPLDPAHPRERRSRLVERAGCLLTVDAETLGGVEIPAAPVEPDWPMPSFEDEAYLLYTSGSTGEPKGVPISHRGLADYLHFALTSYVPAAQPPVGALFTALTFDLTVTSLFVPLLAEGRIVVIGAEGPAGVGALAEDRRITWAKATPSHLGLLVRLLADEGSHREGGSGVPDRHQLRTLVVGGEAFGSQLASDLWRVLPEVEIFNEYGPTEAVVGCMIHRARPDELAERADVPIGRPSPGVELRIVDRADMPVPIGAPGELLISHRGITGGYLDPADGDGRFVELDGARFYRSGDLVRLSDESTLAYLGRIDEQMKVGGIRLDPTEVEHALTAHPAVERAVVRLWQPTGSRPTRHCVRCGLPDNVPEASFDEDGVCATCHSYEAIRHQADAWFRTTDDLAALHDAARRARTGSYDAVHLLSGGKDSTYALYQLVDQGFDVLCLTLDNGFISEGALENVRRSVADLGIDFEILTSDVMNEVFRDSLDRFSNVCHGCYKTIYTLATQRAVDVGAPLIFTGLSRGQLFETRLIPEQFTAGRFDPDAIDEATIQARRAYHRLDDGTNRLLDTTVFAEGAFEDGDVFDRVQYVDFYRYVDVELSEMLDFLESRAPWVRPSDTGRSTNCLVNAAGIHTHLTEQGFHNYAVPYAWDVRLGHKTRQEAMEELDDELDLVDVGQMLDTIGYSPVPRQVLTAWIETVGTDDDVPAVDATELRTFLSDRLPTHAIPSAFVEIDELPLTSNGKVDVKSLPAPRRVHRAGPSLHVSAESPMERVVVSIWERMLGLEPIGVDDDFFALGGDSLAALKMVVELSSEVGSTVREDLAFTHTTPRLLAAAITSIGDAGRGGDPAAPSVRPDGTPPPLSSGEQAILFEQYADPENPRYNVARRYIVEGPIDHDRFVEALRTVVDVHVPLHWTYSDPRRELSSVEAISIDGSTKEVTFESFREASTTAHLRPFDLERGPLGTCLVRRLEDGRTGVTLVFHHVSIDAATFDDLWDQIDRAYGLGSEALPVPVVDYADHQQWHREREERRAADRQFWTSERVARRPAAVVPSPINSEEPDGYVQREASFDLDQLKAGSGSTAFTTALAGLSAVLRPLAEGDDLGIAVTASTRDHPDAEHLVGYYLNTLPLVASVSVADTLAETTGRWSELLGMALAHRTYPFADIVADRRRGQLPPPSVSIMLAFEELAPAKLGTLRAEHEVLATGSAVTDATFFVQGRGQRVTLGLEYAGGFLDRATAERLLDDLDGAIELVLNQPSATVGSIPSRLVTPQAEPRTAASEGTGSPVPAEWNATSHPLSVDVTVQAAFERHAADHPESLAVIFQNEVMTYGDLERRANIVASRLAGRGVEPGHRIGVVARRHPDTVVGALAILKAGAAFVPCDPDYPADRLAQITIDADLQLSLDQEDLVDDGGPDPGPPSVDVADADLAYVIFTSGSTGRPKGVMVTHRNIVESTAARRTVYPGPVGRFLVLSSFAFDSSMVGLFWSLSTGGALVLPDPDRHLDVAHLAQLSERQQVTHLLALPSLYRLLLDEAEGNQLASLDTVIVAGEACPVTLGPEHHRRLGTARLWNEYGPTEGTVWSHVHEVDDSDRTGSVPIGRPIPNMVGHVVDDDGHLVAIGEPGELILGGIGVAAGYSNRADLTEAAFVRLDGALDNGELHYRTGDLVRWLPTGELEFLGRVDHQVKIRGYRIELGELEAAALTHPSVTEAVADAVDGRVEGQRQLALWVIATGLLDSAELRESLSRQLPEFMIPNHVVVLDDLPRTPNGKVDRSSLPRPEDIPTSDFVAPAGELEELVSAVWSDVLGVEQVGRGDDFFALGGDSIMSIQIVSRLRRHGWQVSTRDVFDHPTVAELARRTSRLDPAESTVAGEQGVLSGAVPTLPIHQWFLAQPLANRNHWNQSRWIDLADHVDGHRLLAAAATLPAHHDALRIRVGTTDGGPPAAALYFADPSSSETTGDRLVLRKLVAEADLEHRVAVAEQLEASLDVSAGPIMAAAAFPAHDGLCAQVFVTVHHLAIDAVSWTPLLTDWVAAYRHPGDPLPAKTTSIRQWADELNRWTERADFDRERASWTLRPEVGWSTGNTFTESETELVTVEVDAPAAVSEDHVLAALGHALGRTETIVVEGHGRETDVAPSLDLSRTVGWLTTHHPVEVTRGSDVSATLRAVKQRRGTIRYKGLGHGLAAPPVSGQIPILLNYLGRADSAMVIDHSVFSSIGPMTAGISESNQRLHRLGVMARVANGRLVLVFDHHPMEMPKKEVEAIAGETARFLEQLFSEHSPEPATPTFDLVELDADELGNLGGVLDELDD